MSFAGPTLVAVDQIDGVVNPTALPCKGTVISAQGRDWARCWPLGCSSFMTFAIAGRQLSPVFLNSWKVLQERGLLPFRQRFDDPIAMVGMNDAEIRPRPDR